MPPSRRRSNTGDTDYTGKRRWPWERARRIPETALQSGSTTSPRDDAASTDQIVTPDNGKTGRAAKAKSSAAALSLLTKVLYALIVVSTISVAIPPRPWSPEYYLRLAQFSIDYSPVLILSLSLSIIASFLDGNSVGIKRQLLLARKVTGIALATYLSLIPMQIFCFGWLWVDSWKQVRDAIGFAQTRLDSLRDGIQSADSVPALAAVLASNQPPLPPPSSAPSLEDQKRLVVGALDRDLTQLRTKLNQNRLERISALLLSTLRGVAGSIAMGAGLFALKRLI